MPKRAGKPNFRPQPLPSAQEAFDSIARGVYTLKELMRV
jgi:hypothetical protein